jgi:hypothetical protein
MSGVTPHPALGEPSPSPPGIYRLLTPSTSSRNPQGAKRPPPGCYGSRSRRSGRVPAGPYPPLRDLNFSMGEGPAVRLQGKQGSTILNPEENTRPTV